MTNFNFKKTKHTKKYVAKVKINNDFFAYIEQSDGEFNVQVNNEHCGAILDITKTCRGTFNSLFEVNTFIHQSVFNGKKIK